MIDRQPTYLPPLFFPVVGRESEIAALRALLRDSAMRLVTVTGTGGVGKTCLAIQVAHQLVDEYVDGIVFISLAALDNPESVLPVMAHALGLTDSGDEAVDVLVKRYLRDRHCLLLIDNFEQVIAAAHYLAELILTCGGLQLLVTSREALRLYGEREFPLAPLPVPDLRALRNPSAVRANPSVQLFVSRIQAVQPQHTIDDTDLAAIAEICARLDGLPLALELAAARVKLLSPATLLSYLVEDHSLHLLKSSARNVPARQQTLYSTIEWSYRLLTAPEQKLFRRLATFAGEFTLEAARHVGWASDDSGGDVIDQLESLLDKHLLQRPHAKSTSFAILQTIRQYAFEQLIEHHEDDLVYSAFFAHHVTRSMRKFHLR